MDNCKAAVIASYRASWWLDRLFPIPDPPLRKLRNNPHDLRGRHASARVQILYIAAWQKGRNSPQLVTNLLDRTSKESAAALALY